MRYDIESHKLIMKNENGNVIEHTLDVSNFREYIPEIIERYQMLGFELVELKIETVKETLTLENDIPDDDMIISCDINGNVYLHIVGGYTYKLWY